MAKYKRRAHGEGSIYLRQDGRWTAYLTLDNGKRKYFYGKTQKDVQEKLWVARNDLKQGVLVTGPQQKLSDYLPKWLDEVHKPTIRLSTYDLYYSAICKHILPALGHMTLQKLKASHIQSFYASKVKEGLSPETIRTLHAILHKALENAVKWGLVGRNEASLVSPPRIEKREIKPLTEEQVEKLLTVAHGHPLEVLLLVAVSTGMRRGELLALRWDDVDFAHATLVVQRTVSRVGKHGLVEREPKTRSSRRKIMLPDVVVSALLWHKSQQNAMRVCAGKQWYDRGLVFCDKQGDYLEPAGVLRQFQTLLKKAQLPHMRFHDLRHSAATILLTRDVHPKVVQELLGHSTISMTLDTYSHLVPSMQKESMQVMGEVFKSFPVKGDTLPEET